MIKFAFAFTFERIYFMKFAFDKCEFFLASSHPQSRVPDYTSMALNPLNSSNLEQPALKGLRQE